MCFDVENSWMHKEKKLEISHKGFFRLGTQKEPIFWGIFLDVNF